MNSDIKQMVKALEGSHHGRGASLQCRRRVLVALKYHLHAACASGLLRCSVHAKPLALGGTSNVWTIPTGVTSVYVDVDFSEGIYKTKMQATSMSTASTPSAQCSVRWL